MPTVPAAGGRTHHDGCSEAVSAIHLFQKSGPHHVSKMKEGSASEPDNSAEVTWLGSRRIYLFYTISIDWDFHWTLQRRIFFLKKIHCLLAYAASFLMIFNKGMFS